MQQAFYVMWYPLVGSRDNNLAPNVLVLILKKKVETVKIARMVCGQAIGWPDAHQQDPKPKIKWSRCIMRVPGGMKAKKINP